MANLRGNKMYGKKLVKRVGSLVIAAVIIASAFAILPTNYRKAEAVTVGTAPVILTEIMYDPAGDDAGNEWIELYNMGDETVNLSGWRIEDDDGNIFAMLSGVIAPYEYRVFYGSNLNNDGDTIIVYNASDIEVINITYSPDAATNYSLELDETDQWVESIIEGGTPGQPNSVMNPPVTTHEIEGEAMLWGWYVTNVTVTLNATDETGIKETKYRIDGGAWTTYTTPFVISEPGIHLVEYNSTDVWGKKEATKNFTVNIANLSSALTVTPTEANWNETHTIEINNAEGNVSLYAPREDTPRKGPQIGPYVRWSNVKFDVSGKWWVVDMVDSTECNAFAIDVKPVELNVVVSPDEVDYVKLGMTGSYVNIEGNVTMNGAPATQAIVKLIFPDGSSMTTGVAADGSFSFLDINIGMNGAGEYNVTAYIGNETYPDAFGYDIVMVNPVAPNITLLGNDAVGGFDIGSVRFEVTYPEDGLALLGNDYNISIYKEGELYAWQTKKGGIVTEQGGPINFTIAGKLLNLTSGMWEAGDYTINISVDVTGDGNWEYVGEADYTIQAAPPVNLKILQPADKKMDVKDPGNNSQVIQLQVFGENMTTYGTPEALNIGANNENVTERIKVEGDILYSPPKEAYEYWKNGIWNITVFPTKGNGKIYVNVTWPDKGDAGETIDTVKGGSAVVEPDSIIVDTLTNVTVTVKDNYGNIVPNAQVTMYYEDENIIYKIGEEVENGSITGDGSSGKGLNGVYEFKISSKYAARNIIVVASFQTPGGETFYAYARIRSQPAHDLAVALAPDKVLAGEMTEFTVNITRNGAPYADTFEFYILNETELQKLHDGTLELPAPVYTSNKANDTFSFLETEPGTYYLYVRTTDKKHDNMENEPSFTVSKASVSVEPSLLVKGVDKNITLQFTVTWNGEAVDGTLLVKGLQEVASFEAYVENATYEVEITNGTGSVENVTAIATGTITFEFLPAAAGSVYAEAEGSLEITTPTVEIVEPKERVAFLAVENLITIIVKHPLTGNGIAGLKVEIITPTRADAVEVGETNEDGKLIFGIVPLQTGKIKILVEGEEAGEIEIWVGLKIVMPSEIEKDNEVTILITTRGGKPVEGATVKVDGTTIGTTDANGEIKYKPTEEGTITVTAEKEGYYSASKTVEVKKGAETPGFEFVGIAIAIALIALIYRKRK
ncbi:MAG: PEGA domain-containing protein [Thermoplasmata archaeon]|nr:MAG: PEGA domain-containing protein [Thermoplasmata archaeon]